MSRTCAHCGAEFDVPRGNSKKRYCGLPCANRAKNAERTAAMPICTCRQCGEEFRATDSRSTTFCSRSCSYAYLAVHGFPERRKEKQDPPPFPACEVCGKPCTNRQAKYCSDACMIEVRKQKDIERAKAKFVPKKVVCKQCGTPFFTEYGTHRSVFCSASCSDRYTKKLVGGALNHRARKAFRRMYGCVPPLMYQPLRKDVVMKRDGWVCGICGQSIDKHACVPEPLSPSVDHIVALAAGGAHTYDNVQAAHFECNWKKGAGAG
jgi:hypothetical protein